MFSLRGNTSPEAFSLIVKMNKMNVHHTYTCRSVTIADFERIATFPQNEEELFFMFPQAEFPLTAKQLYVTIPKQLTTTDIKK